MINFSNEIYNKQSYNNIWGYIVKKIGKIIYTS